MSCYAALRPALFLLPPEKAHRAAIRALQMGVAPKSEFTHPSLHTTVAGPEGRFVEVQIRSERMDEIAERGADTVLLVVPITSSNRKHRKYYLKQK